MAEKRKRFQLNLLKKRRALAEDERSLREDQFASALKATKIREADWKSDPGRGVNRVPDHLRGLVVIPTPLVEHYGTPARDRRRQARVLRTRTPVSQGIVEGHKLGGKQVGKVVREVRPGTNQPYFNPARPKKTSRR